MKGVPRWLHAVFLSYTAMNDKKEHDVKNYYYVNGPQNNYTINMEGNASLKIFSNGKNTVEVDESLSHTQNQSLCQTQTQCHSFSSPEADSLFASLRNANILDENNMPINLSWAKKGVLASEIAQRLGIQNTWAELAKLWNVNKSSLRSGYNYGLKQSEMGDYIKKLRELLN